MDASKLYVHSKADYSIQRLTVAKARGQGNDQLYAHLLPTTEASHLWLM